jgi:hypothetical protein
MITFRDINYGVDIPEIIELIKLGLSDKNTIDSFLWKHNENPFGISIGLLACDEEKIVGVRMFMFWEFRKGEKIVKAIRPVDTIIHPNYRGKGLFKKLTLEGLEICENEYDLVFNTPNKSSYPGYIKMGWVNFGERLNYKAAFVLPFSRKNIALERIPLKLIDVNDLKLEYNQFRTHLTNEYLHWRYKDAVYKAVSISCEGKMSIIIYRIEKIKGIKTLIINEIIGEFQNKTQAIRQLVSKEKVFLIYYLENKFSKLDFVLSMNKGDAVVVYREDHFNIMKGMSFSLGDLEGRL